MIETMNMNTTGIEIPLSEKLGEHFKVIKFSLDNKSNHHQKVKAYELYVTSVSLQNNLLFRDL